MTIALIVAAGRGERLRADRPKALIELAGRPLYEWSLKTLAGLEEVERIVLALPADTPAPAGTLAVQGGPVRSDSVRRALAAAPAGADDQLVIVHDAARPLVSARLVRSVLDALARDPAAHAAIAAAPVTDTIKRVGAGGVVSETLDRRELWAVQTPQAFRRGALERALAVDEQLLANATDDAWLIERAGGRVIVVHAEEENLKVTSPEDLRRAAALLAARTAGAARNPA